MSLYDRVLGEAKKPTKKEIDLEKMYADAEKAGFKVKRGSGGDVIVAKYHKGHGGVTRGIHVFEDGVALELNLDLSVQTGLRKVKDMRSILGLK